MGQNNNSNKKSLENTEITPQVSGVRKTVFESMLSNISPSKLIGLLKDAKNGKYISYLTLAEEMEERDAQYRTVLNTRKLQVVSTPFRIKTVNNQDKKLDKIQDFIENITSTPVFKKMLFSLLDGLGKGYSVVEINYEYNQKDKLLYPKTYTHKPPQWFIFNEAGDNLLLLEDDQGKTKELDSIKVIRHIPQLKTGLPIRGGLAFAIASIFVLKNFGLKDWGSMVEALGMPMRLGRYDAGATPDSIEKLALAVASIGVDYSAVIPMGMEIQFVNGNPNSNGDLYLKYVEHLNEQISKVVLGQTMTTDSGSSLSQANIHNITREIIQKADCIDLADTINRDLIKPIVDLNFGEQEFYPYIEFDTAEKEDKQVFKDIVIGAHSVGIPFSLSDARERLGLKEPIDKNDVLKPLLQSSTTMDSLNFDNTLSELNFEEDKSQDEVDIEIEKELEDYQSIMEPIVDDISKVLDNSESIEDAIINVEKAKINTQKLEKSLFKSSIKEFIKIFKKEAKK